MKPVPWRQKWKYPGLWFDLLLVYAAFLTPVLLLTYALLARRMS